MKNINLMLNEGYLTPQQLDLIFRHLPFDVTFVNEKDEVVYYNIRRKDLSRRERGSPRDRKAERDQSLESS